MAILRLGQNRLKSKGYKRQRRTLYIHRSFNIARRYNNYKCTPYLMKRIKIYEVKIDRLGKRNKQFYNKKLESLNSYSIIMKDRR